MRAIGKSYKDCVALRFFGSIDDVADIRCSNIRWNPKHKEYTF